MKNSLWDYNTDIIKAGPYERDLLRPKVVLSGKNGFWSDNESLMIMKWHAIRGNNRYAITSFIEHRKILYIIITGPICWHLPFLQSDVIWLRATDTQRCQDITVTVRPALSQFGHSTEPAWFAPVNSYSLPRGRLRLSRYNGGLLCRKTPGKNTDTTIRRHSAWFCVRKVYPEYWQRSFPQSADLFPRGGEFFRVAMRLSHDDESAMWLFKYDLEHLRSTGRSVLCCRSLWRGYGSQSLFWLAAFFSFPPTVQPLYCGHLWYCNILTVIEDWA